MKAKVDSDLCISCELCVNLCPEVFRTDESGKAAVHADPVPPAAEATCTQAANDCPTNAIKLD